MGIPLRLLILIMRAGGYRSCAMARDPAHRLLSRAGQDGARLGRTDGDLPHRLYWALK